MVVPLPQAPVRGGRSLQLHGQPEAVQRDVDALVAPQSSGRSPHVEQLLVDPQSSGSSPHVERLLVASPPSLAQRPILRQPGAPRRPPRMVHFNITRQEEPPAPPRTGPGHGFPGAASPGVLTRPEPSSTSSRPQRDRRRPRSLDLYAEVWGEPCGGSVQAVFCTTWQHCPRDTQQLFQSSCRQQRHLGQRGVIWKPP